MQKGECAVNQIAQEDVLRALKKFKRLAKQDFLASSLMSNPQFWSEQAEARRAVYDKLMKWVENDGVESAYQKAQEWYVTLPQIRMDEPNAPLHGQEQALEMFFIVLGIGASQIEQWKAQRLASHGSTPSTSDDSRLSMGVYGA